MISWHCSWWLQASAKPDHMVSPTDKINTQSTYKIAQVTFGNIYSKTCTFQTKSKHFVAKNFQFLQLDVSFYVYSVYVAFLNGYVVNAADTSLVSFEAADRPNYFLKAEHSGQLRLQKWKESEAFGDSATFVLHRDTWISGFDSLESLAKPGFFLHFMLSRLQLMKYSHSDRYRRATLFKLTGQHVATYMHNLAYNHTEITTCFFQITIFTSGAIPQYPMGPRCQWRYESCVSPCFRTCSDPSGLSCASILK